MRMSLICTMIMYLNVEHFKYVNKDNAVSNVLREKSSAIRIINPSAQSYKATQHFT